MHKVYDNILETVGDTPLVKLNRVTTGLQCTVYAKVEFMNPAGSVKDRIAIHILEEAERRGDIRPGATIIDGGGGALAIGGGAARED